MLSGLVPVTTENSEDTSATSGVAMANCAKKGAAAYYEPRLDKLPHTCRKQLVRSNSTPGYPTPEPDPTNESFQTHQ